MGVIRDIIVEIESMINDYKALNTKYLDVEKKFTELKELILNKTGVVEYDIGEIKRRLESASYTATEFLSAKNQETAVFDVPYIPMSLFSNSGTLTTISFKQSTRIMTNAFSNCKNLKNVDFSNVYHIDGYAFSRTGLSGHIHLPDALVVQPNCFEDCTGITSITADKVTSFDMSQVRYQSNIERIKLGSAKTIFLLLYYSNLQKLGLIELPNVENVYTTSEPLGRDVDELNSPRARLVVKIGDKLRLFNTSLFNSVASVYIFGGDVPRLTTSSTTIPQYLEKIVVPDEYYDNWKNKKDLSSFAHLIVKASEYNG